MAVKNEKLDELRGIALEKELRKKKPLNLEEGAMEAEIEYQADALAHSNGEIMQSQKKGGGKKVVIAAAAAAILAGGGYMLFNSDSVKKTEDAGICRTLCNDGWCSPSEGSGTCSSHGGIKGNSDNGKTCKTRCNDGSCSESTGPGTCSGHGGIKTGNTDKKSNK